MSEHKISPKIFKDKIPGWEQGRYTTKSGGGVLEKMANLMSSSLRFRLRITWLYLPVSQGQTC